ncbi:hypothetical protein B0H13DRAFT_2362791 [Mycena leptocephala]|nr:hypothetical protein B0H13DRAFT_2362791 [Mycena leptocephala]
MSSSSSRSGSAPRCRLLWCASSCFPSFLPHFDLPSLTYPAGPRLRRTTSNPDKLQPFADNVASLLEGKEDIVVGAIVRRRICQPPGPYVSTLEAAVAIVYGPRLVTDVPAPAHIAHRYIEATRFFQFPPSATARAAPSAASSTASHGTTASPPTPPTP